MDVTFSQAERIIEKFGGVDHLAELLALVGHPLNKSTLHRWKYPKELGGTGGLVPQHAWPKLFEAARLEGLVLKPEDWDPRAFCKPTTNDDTALREKLKKTFRKRHAHRELLAAKRRVKNRKASE